MFSRLFPLLVASFGIFSADFAEARAPIPPTDLKVRALGANYFRLEWKDNSIDEVGWEIKVSLKGTAPARFRMSAAEGVRIPTVGLISEVVVTNPVPGEELVFQVTAYNGAAGMEKFSRGTQIVTARALSPAKFAAPTQLRATPLDDGRIRIGWRDNSTLEAGYQIESRQGNKKWRLLGTIPAGITFKLPVFGFQPSTTHSFRVRAVETTGGFSGYSNIATATTKSFQAPANLIATASGEGIFSFAWGDRSSVEGGFELQSRRGDGEFFSEGTVGANTLSVGPIASYALEADYQFRVRAYRTKGDQTLYTSFSPVVSVKSTGLAIPTGLAVTNTTSSDASLTWSDNSNRESGFDFEWRILGANEILTGTLGANQLTGDIPNLKASTAYEFRMRTTEITGVKSAFTEWVQATTKPGIVASEVPALIAGTQFLYLIKVTEPSLLTEMTVTGLPAGLVFDSARRTISGTLTAGGTFTATVIAKFSDGSSTERSLTLKSTAASPQISGAFAAVNLTAGTSRAVSVVGKFKDPDTSSAARVTTTLGSFDIILFPLSTPATVDNFLDYVDDGSFVSSFFHLAPSNFVIQGGGFRHTAALGYSQVTSKIAVVNEPGLSNIRGTVAMAKLGGLPDSATSQFFVNLGNNSSNLDFKNGGFTVFGRVPTAGMVVIDQINALPKGTYQVSTPNGNVTLAELPLDAPATTSTLDPSDLVKIVSVDAAAILTYSVTSANSAVATASINGTDITITAVAAGTTTIEVKATDLDAQQTTQNITVTVP